MKIGDVALYVKKKKQKNYVQANNVTGMSRIGDRLRASLPSARGEQKALAYRAGVTPETLNRVLTGATQEPGFETIAKIARAAGLDLNRLATDGGDAQSAPSMAADLLTTGDRRKLGEFAAWLVKRFGEAPAAAPATEDNVLEFVPYTPRVDVIPEEGFLFPVPPEQFQQRDFDYPQPWHYWTTADDDDELPAIAAGRRGVPNLLNPRGRDVREVFDRVNQIVRVEGDSMEDRYFHGDLVRIDTRKRSPLEGEPVAVYCEDLGGSLLGFLKRDGDRVILVKKNRAYEDVALPASGWLMLGPIVELVSRKERRERL